MIRIQSALTNYRDSSGQSEVAVMNGRGSQHSKRVRPSNLSPLVTDHSQFRRTIDNSLYRDWLSASTGSTNSSMGLASPSLGAVRQYYKDHGLKTALQAMHLSRNESLRQLDDFQLPRRHSALMPSMLVNGMNTVKVSSPPFVRRGRDTKVARSIAQQSRDMLLEGVQSSELARLGGVVSRTSFPGTQVQLSAAEGGGRLRQWGRAYLGNAATADAFVKAVQLRVPGGLPDLPENASENQLGQGETISTNDTNGLVRNRPQCIIVRARVFPRARERKPFLVQRQFNLEEMRASLPKPRIIGVTDMPLAVKKDDEGYAEEQPMQASLTRSQSYPSMQIAEMAANLPAQDGRSPGRRLGPAGRRIMPIHVEYALNSLPVLAALMLSGHIRKGDAIELPIPYPSAWAGVISYIYTGEGDVTPAMRENILYLAGRVSDD